MQNPQISPHKAEGEPKRRGRPPSSHKAGPNLEDLVLEALAAAKTANADAEVAAVLAKHPDARAKFRECKLNSREVKEIFRRCVMPLPKHRQAAAVAMLKQFFEFSATLGENARENGRGKRIADPAAEIAMDDDIKSATLTNFGNADRAKDLAGEKVLANPPTVNFETRSNAGYPLPAKDEIKGGSHVTDFDMNLVGVARVLPSSLVEPLDGNVTVAETSQSAARELRIKLATHKSGARIMSPVEEGVGHPQLDGFSNPGLDEVWIA